MPGWLTEFLRHVREGGVGIRTNGTNGRQAHDHDQGQHNGVLNRGRAIFRNEETLYFQSKILHSILRFLDWRSEPGLGEKGRKIKSWFFRRQTSTALAVSTNRVLAQGSVD